MREDQLKEKEKLMKQEEARVAECGIEMYQLEKTLKKEKARLES